jgi:DNA polymerase III subunit beta
MEFEVQRDELYNELVTLKKYLSKTVPALSNFLFEADDKNNKLIITASDSHNLVIADIAATVKTAGKCILASTIVFGALKNYTNGKVQFKVDPSGNMYMKDAKKKKIRVPMQNAQSFIAIPAINVTSSLTMKSEELIKIIKQTSFAKLKNPNQASDHKFEGVNLKIQQGQATFTCSDKSRVALGRYKFSSAIDAEYTIGGKPLEDFVSGLEDGLQASINVDSATGKLSIVAGNRTLFPAMYSDKYPDVGRYVPQPKSTVTINRQALLSSLEIAVLVHEHIDLKAENGELKMTNQGAGTGAYTDAITATVSAPSDVSLRASYFIEGLKAMSGDEVELMIEDAKKPVIIRPKQQNDYAYLLIPVI